MKKVIDSVNRFGWAADYTPDDWNAAVQRYFRPFVKRTSVLRRDKEIFRSELINLFKILPFPANTELLLQLLAVYRRILRRKTEPGFELLIHSFPHMGKADERWMGLFMNVSRPSRTASAHDRAFWTFDVLDGVLEGCYKPHLRLLYGMMSLDAGGAVPVGLGSMDFGVLLSQLPRRVPNLDLILEDPEHEIGFNHWRNIAAHKDFHLVSSRTVEISFGRPQNRHRRSISIASAERTLTWSVIALGTLRMCNTLIYLEYMPELKTRGLPDLPMRFEGHLTRLCHNLSIVGFRCTGVVERSSVLTIQLQNCLSRSVRDAIIHASQILDQLSTAVTADPTRNARFDRVAVELVDGHDRTLARASVAVTVAVDHTLRKISLKRYLSNMEFSFQCSPDRPAV
jgi:hypothetical protein